MLGVQAQDVRAAALALRSRAPGLERAELDAGGLVRTWTVRGTVHLLDVDDLGWMHALTGPRNRRTFDQIMRRRGALDTADGMREDIGALLARGPLARTELLAGLAGRGHASLGDYAVNVFSPWAAAHGLLVSRPGGTLCAPPALPDVPEEEALAILGRRYLAGYGPARAEDLAKWSGLGLGAARRALQSVAGAERAGELLALPETLDTDPPAPPPVRLLAGFDTLMLGWQTRAAFTTPAADARILRGGGIIRPVVLVRGRAAGTWRLDGPAARRRVAVEWLGGQGPERALAAEEVDVLRFLATG